MPSLEVSDFAPWFSLPSTVNPLFHFDTVAGRRLVLFFFGSAALEPIQLILKSFQSYQEEFSRLGVLLFGVSIDRKDEAEKNCRNWLLPSTHFSGILTGLSASNMAFIKPSKKKKQPYFSIRLNPLS